MKKLPTNADATVPISMSSIDPITHRSSDNPYRQSNQHYYYYVPLNLHLFPGFSNYPNMESRFILAFSAAASLQMPGHAALFRHP